MRKHTISSIKKQDGFTIVELLFATTVFTLVLLVAATGFLQVTRIYYRSVITSRTQDITRTVVDDVAQAIQFNAGSVQSSIDTGSGDLEALCVGSVRYNINLGQQITSSADRAMVRDNGAGSAGCVQAADSDGTELLGSQMRLHSFAVNQVGDTSAYNIRVRVIYGDDDLIDGLNSDNPVCTGLRFGGQFCAVSELNTTVTRRIRN